MQKKMLERFLKQTEFTSMEDFRRNFELRIPENFNFAYDVMDVRAAEEPGREAMLWVNDRGDERHITFGFLKEESDRVAGYFTSLGIGRGDMVMLILKRRFEFWPVMLALHKIGAVAVPATFLLTEQDIVYRCKSAEIKAIVCCGEPQILSRVTSAEPKCPYLDHMISIGPEVPEGWEDYASGVAAAKPWERNGFKNASEDPFLMYFTSGTSDEPKMVLHSHTYALSHLVTAAFWHNLSPEDLHLT